MYLVRSFRFSTYLTLAMACVCLGYAEGRLLPESPFITGAVILSIGVAYHFEGRWSLSLRDANILGGVLILTLIGWGVYRLTHKPPEIEYVPFPAVVLPYLGPVLMILVPAKLFRPKHYGDFWAMQGIGLLAVALGCAMANDMFFGVLLIAYMFCFAWSISLFHLYREARVSEVSAWKTKRATTTYLFRSAWRWSVVISPIGLLLFLATPRPTDSKWELPMAMRGRIETGLADSNIDLNRTGTLEQDKELAFSVEAKDADGAAKLDLDPNQRWRSTSLAVYDGGKWLQGREPERVLIGAMERPPSKVNSPPRTDGLRLPDFGPRSYTLTYTLERPAAAMTIAASPILWRPNDRPPIQMLGSRAGPVRQRPDRSFDWMRPIVLGRPAYVQVTAATSESDLGPAMTGQLALSNDYLEFLTRLPGQVSDRLRRYTSHLLARYVQEGRLAASAIEDVHPFTGLPGSRHHEAIARVLEHHLSSSGEFRYTTQLERVDRNLDPVEDFLFNTKAGHCQRFASALALMLRSQGIPAQLVLGFRGCETLGSGRYEIRQYHAHAWVEAVIQRSPPAQVLPLRPGEAPIASPTAQHWLSLDPTPAGSPEKEEKNGFGDWLEQTLSRGENFFKHFILAYDAAARQKAFDSIAGRIEEFRDDVASGEITWPVAIVGGCALLIPTTVLVRWRLRRRRRLTPQEIAQRRFEMLVPFHSRLLELLARHGIQPRAGQTALEFAKEASGELAKAGADSVADIPVQIADAYYRARFGDRMPSISQRQELDDALNRLAEALKTFPVRQPLNGTT